MVRHPFPRQVIRVMKDNLGGIMQKSIALQLRLCIMRHQHKLSVSLQKCAGPFSELSDSSRALNHLVRSLLICHYTEPDSNSVYSIKYICTGYYQIFVHWPSSKPLRSPPDKYTYDYETRPELHLSSAFTPTPSHNYPQKNPNSTTRCNVESSKCYIPSQFILLLPPHQQRPSPSLSTCKITSIPRSLRNWVVRSRTSSRFAPREAMICITPRIFCWAEE